MAVELTSYVKQSADKPKEYQIACFADEKADVAPGMVIKNLPSDWVIQPGSTIVTADGEVAFYKSNNKWHFVGEEEDIDVG